LIEDEGQCDTLVMAFLNIEMVLLHLASALRQTVRPVVWLCEPRKYFSLVFQHFSFTTQRWERDTAVNTRMCCYTTSTYV